MLKKITILFSIALLFALFFSIFLKSKGTLELNVSYINFYLKNKISKMFANSSVNVGSTSVIWQRDGTDPHLVITDLKVVNPSFTIKVPNIFIHFKSSSVLQTSVNFSQVLADNVCVHINQEKDAFKAFDFHSKNLLKAVRKLFFSLNAGSRFEITNISINKSAEGKFFIDKAYVEKGEDFNVLDIRVHTINDQGFLDDLSITIKNRNNLLNLYGAFYNLKLWLFKEFSTLIKSYNLEREIGLKGNFSIRINGKDEVVDGNIYILNTENYSGKNLALTNVNINLTFRDEIISVKNFNFKLNGMYLSLIGKINFCTNHTLLRVNISKFAAKDLCAYTPDNIVNNRFKTWYCNNVDGDIVNTIISFNGKINRLVNNDLSDVVIAADIENFSVRFDEDFEQVKGLNGDFVLKNNNLTIAVHSAKFQNFNIDGGSIEMNLLNKEKLVVVINGKATSDAYGLYEPIKFKLNDMVQITRDKIGGIAKSVFSFRVFNLDVEDKKVDFLANFHSKIDDLVVYGANLGEHNIRIDFGMDFIDLNGSGMVNNTQLLFDLKSRNKNKSFAWNLTGDLPTKIINFDGGYINTSIESVINQDKTGYIAGNIDLSKLELRLSHFGWRNRFEDHNKIVFSTKLKGSDELLIDKLDVVGNELDIKFSGKVKNGNLYLNSSTFELPNNSLNVEIELGKERNFITIYGEKINLSNILGLLGKNNSGLNSDIEVYMNVDNVMMKEGIIVKDAKLHLICITGDCSESKFTGQFLEDNSKISAKYSRIGLELYADNSGILLRSLGIGKSVRNGKLSFHLSPKRENGKHYGMLSISNFYIKDASLLTTLLSMSSLHGIVNAVKNEGVYFYKYNAPFSYKDGTVEIEESWLEGAELGISTSGKLNIKDYKFQVAGQVIPAYSINRSLLKIPIIGKLLTGGKSRGIISIDYKASGDAKNSNVSVNPISSLTPSLFKGLLGVFDRAMAKMATR